MKRIEIIALLAVIMMPISGCLGGTIGDATAQDPVEENGATIVYNFYNNSTTDHPQLAYKSQTYHVEFQGGQWNNIINFSERDYVHVGTLNTTGGNLFSVVYSVTACETQSGWWDDESSSICRILIRSTCDGVEYVPKYAFQASETNSFMLDGTLDSDCVHDLISYRPISTLGGYEIIGFHYEIAFKEIPTTPHS